MKSPRITILGGSSPFTCGLIDALVPVRNEFDRPTLVLHGRSVESLSLVARYAEHWLTPHGWNIEFSTSLSDSLVEADIVLHQIRYGDLSLRAAGERLCYELNLVADETLGPAALQTAIRTLPDLERTSNAINRECPDAFVLNLTNPLSAMTWAMTQFRVRRCVGLCELPLVTQQIACEEFGVESKSVSWTYSGLNHRGFIDSLMLADRDLLAELPGILSGSSLPSKSLAGIAAETIEELGALPLKYFRLLSKAGTANAPKPSIGRADDLCELRAQIQTELSASCATSPPSLGQRYMDWYPHSVAPLLVALCQSEPSEQMLNIARPDGLVVESMAIVSAQGWQPNFHESQNEKVVAWNERFEVHERHFLAAMFEPTRDKIESVFLHDPMMSQQLVVPATNALLSVCNERALNAY